MPTGIIKSFYPHRGFGYITVDKGSRSKVSDLFFHVPGTRARRRLQQGQRVRFEIVQAEHGPCASEVRPIIPRQAKPTPKAPRSNQGSDRAVSQQPSPNGFVKEKRCRGGGGGGCKPGAPAFIRPITQQAPVASVPSSATRSSPGALSPSSTVTTSRLPESGTQPFEGADKASPDPSKVEWLRALDPGQVARARELLTEIIRGGELRSKHRRKLKDWIGEGRPNASAAKSWLQAMRDPKPVARMKPLVNDAEFAERWKRWTDELLESCEESDVCWKKLESDYKPGRLRLRDPTAERNVLILAKGDRNKEFLSSKKVAKYLDRIADYWTREREILARKARRARSGKREEEQSKDRPLRELGAFGVSGPALTDFGWHAPDEDEERRIALQVALMALGAEGVVGKLNGCRLTNWYRDYERVIDRDLAFVHECASLRGTEDDWCIVV